MKKSLLSITVLMLFLFCTMTVVGAQTSPQVMAFDVKPDGQLILESDLGAIDVKTASLDKVDIVVTKEAEKSEGGLQKARKSEEAFTDIDVAEALADFEVTFKQKETDVHIKGKFKRGREHWEKKQGLLSLLTIRYEVTIPYQYSVNLTTSRDDISVADLAGELQARTSSNGGITLAGCKGNVDVKTSVGDVNLSNITGSVTAIGGDIQIINVGGGVIAQASSSGSITVKDCQSNVDIKASVGNIDLTNITGTVKSSTGSSGNITVKDCRNNIDVKASVGNIDLTNIKGSVKSSTGSSGNITLKGCESDVDVKTSVGDVNLSNITGSVTAIGGDIQIINVGGGVIAQASSSGSITVKDCQSNVDIKASVGNIDLANITGSVKARTGSSGNITLNNCQGGVDVLASVGDIRTEMIKQPQHELTLQTSGGGGIVATLISQIALNIDAQTSRGNVSSDLPIQVSELSKNNLKGTINGGGPLLKLRASSGDIRLEKR